MNNLIWHQEKHLFALHVPTLSSLIETCSNKTFVLNDETIAHRMQSILRLKPGDKSIFFDHQIHAECTIVSFTGKKQILCTIITKNNNRILTPSLTFLLPLLKRNDFEDTLYSLTEIGVTTIQLLFTQKIYSSSFTHKDMERAQRIIIAAAEQSKNFSYPHLKAPVPLTQIINTYNHQATKIFFDSNGISFLSVIQRLHIDQPKDIVLLIGPEGDLSNEEKEMVVSKQFTVCRLTETVLRSTQAAAVSTGIIRSLVV